MGIVLYIYVSLLRDRDTMGCIGTVAIIFLCLITIGWTLSIVRNHDKPCIAGDAWTEECKSCYCDNESVAHCRPTFCASKLQSIDKCKEGEITKVQCNTCICHKNVRECTKKRCTKP